MDSAPPMLTRLCAAVVALRPSRLCGLRARVASMSCEVRSPCYTVPADGRKGAEPAAAGAQSANLARPAGPRRARHAGALAHCASFARARVASVAM